MKFTVTVTEDENIQLQLGLNHAITFTKDAPVESIVTGIQQLVYEVTGIDTFELAKEVLNTQMELYIPTDDLHAEEAAESEGMGG